MSFPGLVRSVLSLALAVSAGAATPFAQSAYSRPRDPNNPLSAHLVKNGLYLFSAETNSLVRMSASGFIVIDGQPPENYDALLKQIDRLSEQPIRVLITTDHHEQRTGSNAKFVADGAQILAQENVVRNLAKHTQADARTAAPTKTYDRDFTVALGGIEVKVHHFGNAHTNGDSVVYFPVLRVVAVGDLFAATPDPDYAAGGSLVGWGPVLGEILKLDFDVVVPGSGPPVSRADLVAFKTKIDTLVSRAGDLVKKGVPKTRLMAQLRTDDLGWQ
jgi:glyoxylase-like metal-dependent hydrolase (beta-lactamase superfamily II)